MALALYLVTISIDAVRKVAGLPTSALGIIYLIVGGMYAFLLPGIRKRLPVMPLYLPVCLILITFWCAVEAIAPRIPVGMALLGWASYVFFVPLLYIGCDLMGNDRTAAKALRAVVVAGGVIGLGAIASAVLGQSAPTILQPITPSVGIHSSDNGNIFLSPSVFATGEEAAEHLVIALFAWIALTYLPSGRRTRWPSSILAILVAVGLFAAERRTDIFVAILGIAVLMILGRSAGRIRGGRLRSTATTARRQASPALILGAIGSVVFISFLGASRIVPFLTSKSNAQSTLSVMFSPTYSNSFTGQGTGTSTQGANVLGVTSFIAYHNGQMYAGYDQNGRNFITAEGGLAKTWLELGIVGVVLYGGVFISALGRPIRSLRQLDGVGRALTILALALGVVFLKGHQSLDDPLVQPLFWLCAGGAWGRMRARGQLTRGTGNGMSRTPARELLAHAKAADPSRLAK